MDITGHFHILVYAGLLFLVSQIFGRLAKHFGAPRLIGYLTAGVVFGPSFLGVFTTELLHGSLHLVTEIALSLIAYSIGCSLSLKKLKGLKGSILSITFFQAFGAALLVFGATALLLPYFLPLDRGFQQTYLPIALILGAVSAATAPAAILSLVRETKAKGPFTKTLLGVVALDDALVLVFYAFAVTMAQSLIVGETISLKVGVIKPLAIIWVTLLLGGGVGLLLKWIIAYFPQREVLLGLIFGSILLISGLAFTYELSPLLGNMAFGVVVANFIPHPRSDDAAKVIEDIEEPIFGAFFLLAGAHFNIWILGGVAGLALVLLLVRFLGKWGGTQIGSRMVSTPEPVRKYLGLALLPTAGVTVGLTLEANVLFSFQLPQLCSLMVSAVVCATLINEFLTPFLVRHALKASGDIK